MDNDKMKMRPFPHDIQEPLKYIDNMPDKYYPLRVLRAYRESCDFHWGDSAEGSDTPDTHPVFKELNDKCAARAKILDHAIEVLEYDLLNRKNKEGE